MGIMLSAADARQSLSPLVYNGLPELEDASKFVQANGLVEKMEKSVGKIFTSHGVHGRWGIYLLHHHWDIDAGEIPGEDLIHPLGDNCEMRPVPVSSCGFVPLTYSIGSDGFRALEFSNTKYAREAHQCLAESRQFQRELAAVMLKSGLYKHFGLGVIRPNERPERCWVESTATNERRSVMELLSADTVDWKKLTQTSWAFDGREGHRCRWKCGNCLTTDGAHAGKLQ
jgi:hypothetical protein